MTHRTKLHRIASTLGALAAGAILTVLNAEAAISVGGSAWIWENPLPQGNSLNAVSCPSLDVCFAVGDLETILTSTNVHTISPTFSGQNPPIPKGGPVTLRGISCPSTTVCYAVGDRGAILKTDNGTTWFFQPSGASVNLRDISCSDTSTCFAVGDFNEVLMTQNGGGGWSPIPFGQTGDSLSSISCQPTSGVPVCFAVGALIGGSTGKVAKVFFSFNCSCWTTAILSTPEVFPHSMDAISCSSTSACVAVDQYGNDVFTTDGGNAWSLTVVDSKASLYAVSCVTGTSNCTAVGDAGTPNQLIFVSVNGGSTWLAVPPQVPFREPFFGVSCQNFGSGACIAVGFDGAIIGNPSSGIPHSIEAYYTTNNPVNLSRASCPGVDYCYAVGGGQILATTNGGATWAVHLSETNNNLAAISCPSKSVCFAAGNPVLLTTNGGGTWTSKPTGSSDTLAAISCPTATTCFAAGSSSILATTNQGASWVNQFTPSFPLLGISCASASFCVAVGLQGEIARTLDGVHWTSQVLHTPDLHDVSCPTTTNCISVGNGSTILATANSGASWSQQTVPAGHDFSSVSCLSSSLCDAGTFQGEIFDGPGTWTREAAIDPIYALEGMSCQGALLRNRCVAVGTVGTILSKEVVFTILGTGELTPSQGSSNVGEETAFQLTWTVPAGKSWRSLQSLDLKLSDNIEANDKAEGNHGNRSRAALWARFYVGNPSSFAVLDADGNIVEEGLSGTRGTIETPTFKLDLARSSFVGTGPTGPSITIDFVISFKSTGTGDDSRSYKIDISATDAATGALQSDQVGTWAVREKD